MRLICLNQIKDHKKECKVKQRIQIILLLIEDCDFHSFTKLEPTIANNFLDLLGVIWNYVKRSCSCIVVTIEDP